MLYVNGDKLAKANLNTSTAKPGILTGIFELTGPFSIYEGDQPTIYVNRTSTTAMITNKTSVDRPYIYMLAYNAYFHNVKIGTLAPNEKISVSIGSDEDVYIIII